jgi:hypothetical protein
VPRYFFNVTQGDLPREADEGMDLPNDEAAWEEATTACGEMIKELDGKLKAGPEWRMEVTDASGGVVYRLRFSAEAYERSEVRPPSWRVLFGFGPWPTPSIY